MDESLFNHEEFDCLAPKSLTQRQVWVYGVIEEETGFLQLYMMSKPNARSIEEILATIVEPYTVFHSDAHPMYKAINWERLRLANLIHIHKKKRDLFHSCFIEGVWWVLKHYVR
jgi:hypothetical protein